MTRRDLDAADLGVPAIGALSHPLFGWEGSSSSLSHRFFFGWEGSTKIDYRKSWRQLILTSLLGDLVTLPKFHGHFGPLLGVWAILLPEFNGLWSLFWKGLG